MYVLMYISLLFQTKLMHFQQWILADSYDHLQHIVFNLHLFIYQTLLILHLAAAPIHCCWPS